MTTEELEVVIREIIDRVYECEFNKKIKVVYDGESYHCYLYIVQNKPLVFSIQTNDENIFLKYVEKELVERELVRVKFFKGFRKWKE